MNPKVHTDFDLRICDIFRLSDQRTVIVGVIDDHPNRIGATDCRIVVDGVEKGTITINGEELLENAQRNRDTRALSTNDQVPLDSETIRTADCRLVAVVE